MHPNEVKSYLLILLFVPFCESLFGTSLDVTNFHMITFVELTEVNVNNKFSVKQRMQRFATKTMN